jgi:3-hydroxybutyryl-CoA dehydratase
MALLSLDDIRAKGAHSERLAFTERDLQTFCIVSRDTAGIHMQADFARQKGFRDRIVHGFLAAVPFSRILGMELPGENAVIGSLQLEFRAPVYLGEEIEYTVTVGRVLAPLGTVVLDMRAAKADGTVCIEGKTTCVVREGGRA